MLAEKAISVTSYLTRPGTKPQLAMAQLKTIARTILSRW
jgi:hypothetical protein